MTGEEIRKKFLDFFYLKKHTIVPSSSLIPDDPSVLLTTAGMQQFKPYYLDLDPKTTVHPSLGKPVGLNVASVQKCFRTSDIDEVGDESHLTFFEMLGNFSFGGYFKKEAIWMAYEFLTSPKWMGLQIDYVTIFDPKFVPDGDWRKNVPFDEESLSIWREIGIPEEKIKRQGIDVFWGPTGDEGPCGPTTEIYVKNAKGIGIEIWNLVFNEYKRSKDLKLEKLKKPGIDTGMGLERLVMVSQKTESIFETDLFIPLMQFLELNDKENKLSIREKRILADHLRGIAFLIADGVLPSNKEAGYILRRLIRRFIVKEYLNVGLKSYFESMVEILVKEYGNFYQELKNNRKNILDVFKEEKEKFLKTLQKGIGVLEGMAEVDALSAFKLFETYGLPYEVIKELGGEKTQNLTRDDFEKEFEKHREISKAGVEKKFGGHGLILDTGELKAESEEEIKIVTRLHTATHLLHQALRLVLGEEVKQMGSDITPERTRFDFSFKRKLTLEELQKVEGIVNDIIQKDYDVKFVELPKEQAEKTGALHFFKAKYPEVVKVYYVTPKGKGLDEAWSKEFCGGPHITHTSEIGKFRIIKEESVASGVRRIRAIVED
jgi:alanyl-tRNA synthetase